MLDPQSWRRPIDVGHDKSAGRYHRLPSVDFRHLEAAPSKSSANPRGNVFVFNQRTLQHVGHNRPREIVVGRPQAAATDKKVYPRQGVAYGSFEITAIVTDDRLKGDL